MRFSSGIPTRSGWIEIAPGVSTPSVAVTEGPSVQWNHIDGPLLHWAGHMHWMTWRERFSIFFGLRTIDQIACARWPNIAELRTIILEG